MRGTISNVLTAKSYGFIHGENGQEYFFHKDDLNGNWQELCLDWSYWRDSKTISVSFEAKSTPKGPRAVNVNLVQHT